MKTVETDEWDFSEMSKLLFTQLKNREERRCIVILSCGFAGTDNFNDTSSSEM